jgi:hypothetical protein
LSERLREKYRRGERRRFKSFAERWLRLLGVQSVDAVLRHPPMRTPNLWDAAAALPDRARRRVETRLEEEIGRALAGADRAATEEK